MKRFVLAATLALAATPAAAFDAEEKSEIETIVREYLLANPEIMVEMQQAFEARQRKAQEAAARVALEENREKVFSSEYQAQIGPDDADVTIVEFFDYNCYYCGRGLDDMNKLLESDPKVKFVLKELPIIRAESVGAHRVSLAVSRLAPEKYAEFHNALFAVEGVKTDQDALRIAGELGLEREKLVEEANSPAIEAALRESTELAQALGATGTPFYVVGDEFAFGAQGFEELRAKVANLRSCGSATCS